MTLEVPKRITIVAALTSRQITVNKYNRKRYYANPEVWRTYYRERGRVANINLREETLERYSNGTFQCVLCGFANRDALVVDHIQGRGRQHRHQLYEQGLDIYRWLHNNNYPIGFRVLCMNCQFLHMMSVLHSQRSEGDE